MNYGTFLYDKYETVTALSETHLPASKRCILVYFSVAFSSFDDMTHRI